MYLQSGLWIDEPDVDERIESMRRAEQCSEAEAASLRRFARDGFVVIDPEIPLSLYAAVEADVDRLWRERPADLAYAYDGPARSMRHADESRDRRTRYRIHDAHSHARSLRELYFEPTLHRWMDLLLGEPGVAIQSLYFQYGSEQMLHRDPIVVPTAADGHLFAAWIALEDIEEGAGALVYVPGSHRLPYFEFAPGEYRFDATTMGAAEIEAGNAFEEKQMREHGLEPRVFTAKRGQVLLWHANLRHGGSPVTNEQATRRSFVVHFSTRRTYLERSITISEPTENGDRPVVASTREVLQHDGCFGFENPLAGYRPDSA